MPDFLDRLANARHLTLPLVRQECSQKILAAAKRRPSAVKLAPSQRLEHIYLELGVEIESPISAPGLPPEYVPVLS